MSKFLAIAKTQTATYMAYRLSFLLWRVRNFINFLIIYFLWSSVFIYKKTIFSYSQETMITYVLMVSVVTALVLSTRATDISNEIVSGSIINFLLKPLSFLTVAITREITDKIVNGFFAVIEIVLFILIVQPHIYIQTSPVAYVFFFIALIIGISISFSLSLILSLLAFWTSEVWAPRFIYFILISVLAGTSFPLDILPPAFYKILILTPFPYLIYLPLKIYLSGFSLPLVTPLIIGVIWMSILFVLARKIWKKGLQEFSFYGR